MQSETEKQQQSLTASLLGFYGAIRCAVKAGHDPEDVFAVVLAFVEAGDAAKKCD